MPKKYQSLQERYVKIYEDVAPVPAAVVAAPLSTNVASPSKTEMQPVMTPGENAETPNRPEFLEYVKKHADKLNDENLKVIYRLLNGVVLDQRQGRLRLTRAL